ncbi:MAG: ATP-binding protein [Flavobacteriales bacterium]|nr:ATP-binding protein [Flavobacteriales bacterium]
MEENNDIEKLKAKLNEALQGTEVDNDLIIQLSQQIASLDKSKVRFSIDAGVIDRLGKELVARQETAVSELVKNAYDADALEVSLTFENSDSVGGDLTISDDGDGMTREELVNGFMRISSTTKIHNPVSRKYKRQRAGKKGIGRFAVQRLGAKLTIITQTSNSENALKLSIDWDEYKKDLNLMSISNSLEVVPKEKEKGTTLIIENLRDKWSVASIKRIYRYVSDIIQPFPLSDNHKVSNATRIEETGDTGFKSVFYKKTKENIELIADNDSEIFDFAIAKIEGWLDNNGIGLYSINSEKLDINEINEIGNDEDDNSIPFEKIKNVNFIAYYFIHEKSLIPTLHSTRIKKLANTKGGIRLYRNGFRVLPYGEPADDWLKLDKSQRQRSILPQHGNNNFFGFVEINDQESIFEETSSREGLTENEAFIELQNLVYRMLMSAVVKVANTRKIKVRSGQEKDEKGDWVPVDVRISNIAKTIEELEKELEDGNPESSRRRRRRVKRIKDDIDELAELQKSEQAKYIKERSMLRVLSSVGLSIAQFIHEIKYYLGNMNSDVQFLVDNLEKDSETLLRSSILKDNFSSFKTYTAYFDDVVSKNVIRELIPINMEETITEFASSISSETERTGVEIITGEFPAYRIFTKPMHPSEWSSILFNFYTNSKKAIDRAKVNEGKVLIEVGEADNLVYVEFSDNGDGIPSEIEEKIFDEFFTTTTQKSFDELDSSSEILGTGLGLKIVKDIVKSYRGSISVVSPKEEYSTTIRVEIPMATEKDYEKYDL